MPRGRQVLQNFRRSIDWKKAAEKWRRRLLAEFLKKRDDETKSEEKTAENNSCWEIKVRNNEVITLPDDLLFKILILVPAESLGRLQLVCKSWFNLINSSVFIRRHTEQSDTSFLICRNLTLSPLPIEGNPKSYFHLLDLDHEDHNFIESNDSDWIDIRASCDGLVLAVKENKSLILLNPMTRKHTHLPSGTVTNYDCVPHETYGISFHEEERTYKVVHLFLEKSWYKCEILTVSTRKWKTVEGPSYELLGNTSQIPLSLNGSLYWMPRKCGCDYFVYMNVKDEKFVSEKLPVIHTANDRFIKIRRDLGFVTYVTDNPMVLMQVWIFDENCWVKRNSISLNCDFWFLVPVCCSRNGKEMVFASSVHHLSVYDFEKGEMRQVYSIDGDEAGYPRIEMLYLPHQNTLASWEFI